MPVQPLGLAEAVVLGHPEFGVLGDHGLRGLRRLDDQRATVCIMPRGEPGTGEASDRRTRGTEPAISAGTADCATADAGRLVAGMAASSVDERCTGEGLLGEVGHILGHKLTVRRA